MTTTITSTKNVRIIVLPSHSCGGTLNCCRPTGYSSTQTSADGLNGWTAPSQPYDWRRRRDFGMSGAGSRPESGNRLFHVRAAATGKARSPRVAWRVDGTQWRLSWGLRGSADSQLFIVRGQLWVLRPSLLSDEYCPSVARMTRLTSISDYRHNSNLGPPFLGPWQLASALYSDSAKGVDGEANTLWDVTSWMDWNGWAMHCWLLLLLLLLKM